MMRMRSNLTRCGVAAGALLVFTALTPAHADGLNKFETIIKPTIPPNFTYGSAQTIGENGFVLKDVKIAPPPAGPGQPAGKPVTIRAMNVEEFDFDAVGKNAPPAFAKLRFEGIVVGPGVVPVDFKPFVGTDTINADFVLDYKSDPAKETLAVNKLELRLDGLARLELTLALDGVTPASAAATPNAKDKAVLRSASLVLEDRSLLGKLVPALAAMQQMPADAAVTLATVAVNSERATLPADAIPPLDALSAFIADYAAPKGPLTVTLNPPAKLDFEALGKAAQASGVVKVLGLKVDYAGTRPWVAPAAPAAPTPAPAQTAQAPATPAPAAAPEASLCAANSRVFVLDDNAWKAATVREATSSGRCILKLEAGGTEVVSGADKLTGWTIDGPGKAWTSCNKGDKVIAESEGAWYHAEIKGAARGGLCGVHYDGYDSSDDEDLAQVKIRVLK